MADINREPKPGWIGGFAQSNPAFAYPDPDLSSLPMLDNMANIGKLERQQKVLWPQFSWETVPGDPASRCYQMFAPDISRIGYTSEGRVYSIICPQQGAGSKALGALNVEVTVTSQRGWVDETAKTMAGDMTVEPKIWFSPGADDAVLFYLLQLALSDLNVPMPVTKADAIRLNTYLPGNPHEPNFKIAKGLCRNFPIPAFAKHYEDAWDVANVEVEIGNHFMTGCAVVDDFNTLVMKVFNIASGSLLAPGNTLSWNVWFTAPEYVDNCEWYQHAEKWRKSIDVDHCSPDGNGTVPQYYDGSDFKAGPKAIIEEVLAVAQYLERHGDALKNLGEEIWQDLEDRLERDLKPMEHLPEELYARFKSLVEKVLR